MDKGNLKICKNCIYDEHVRGISFDKNGICNYCHMTDSLLSQYKTGTPEGEKMLGAILAQIKTDGKGKKYDCIVGVSGGTDSSFLVAKLVEWGLRPLAVHYDNTWNSKVAKSNMEKVLTKLNVDLEIYSVNDKEIDDIFLSFMLAGVPELDASTDLALAEVTYRAASKHKIKYVMEGHSFTTEGVAPLGAVYFDGKYIKSIHKQFGKIPMKTYPLMDFRSFMKWIMIKRIKKIRPLWYIDYSKEEARKYLVQRFGWQYYGGHHLENRLTAFNHTVYFAKFGIDLRNLTLAASVRSGLMDRNEALDIYYNDLNNPEDELVIYFKNRMQLTDVEYEKLLQIPIKSYKDYPTYKPLFEKLRPLFYVLAKANLVPMSFYIKYTSKSL